MNDVSTKLLIYLPRHGAKVKGYSILNPKRSGENTKSMQRRVGSEVSMFRRAEGRLPEGSEKWCCRF